MKTIPREFEQLLSREGRRLLDGKHALRGSLARGQGRFVSSTSLIDGVKARGVAKILEQGLEPLLVSMANPIPVKATWGMKKAYTEKLPKTVRVRTAMLDDDDGAPFERAKELGLISLLKSASFHAFAEALSGYPLRKEWGLQALRYGPGDYSGPHNDHHPDEPLGCDGYTDLHLTFSSSGVDHQWIVYERQNHLSEITSLATMGGVTCYRLPFWHYTTPLVAKPRARETAFRWVLLGTFLDQWD